MYIPLSRKSSGFLFIRHYTLFFFLIWLTRLTQRKVWFEFSSDIFYFSCKHPLLVWLNRLLLFIWETDIAHTYFQDTQHWKIQSRKEKLIKKEDKAWLWKHLRSLRKRKPPMQLYLSKWTMSGKPLKKKKISIYHALLHWNTRTKKMGKKSSKN